MPCMSNFGVYDPMNSIQCVWCRICLLISAGTEKETNSEDLL